MTLAFKSSKVINIALLGPSLETYNRGVSALTESSIKCILARWPDAHVTLLAGARKIVEYKLSLNGRTIQIKTLPIRFCKNIFLKNHFCVLFFYACILKLVPLKRLEKAISKHNECIKKILEIDLVADITGGFQWICIC